MKTDSIKFDVMIEALGPVATTETVVEALVDILRERVAAEEQHGQVNALNSYTDWFTILGEEVGELAQAILHHKHGGPAAGNIYAEAKQVGAMALAIMMVVRERG